MFTPLIQPSDDHKAVQAMAAYLGVWNHPEASVMFVWLPAIKDCTDGGLIPGLLDSEYQEAHAETILTIHQKLQKGNSVVVHPYWMAPEDSFEPLSIKRLCGPLS